LLGLCRGPAYRSASRTVWASARAVAAPLRPGCPPEGRRTRRSSALLPGRRTSAARRGDRAKQVAALTASRTRWRSSAWREPPNGRFFECWTATALAPRTRSPRPAPRHRPHTPARSDPAAPPRSPAKSASTPMPVSSGIAPTNSSPNPAIDDLEVPQLIVRSSAAAAVYTKRMSPGSGRGFGLLGTLAFLR
jgi:hypothetical protein